MMKLNKIVESAQNKVHGMTRYKSIARGAWCMAASLLALSTLPSCSDDLGYDIAQTPTHKEGTLSICIPNIEGAAQYGRSRADEGNTLSRAGEAQEGDIKSLWICAYPTSGNTTGDIIVENIYDNRNLNVSSNQADYNEYTVEGFKEGDYHIYVLANLEDYLSDSSILSEINKPSEETIRQILLNFSSSKFPEIGNLPMACLDTQVSDTPNGAGIASGIFSFNHTDHNTLYADLRFLVAKVRYTILFDNSGETGTNKNFSSEFSSNNVDFNEDVAVTNIVPQVALSDGTITSTTKFSHTAALSHVAYPADDKYFNVVSNTDSEQAPANLGPAEGWTTSTSKRAWQGVIYLPENNVSADAATVLTFTPSANTEIKSENCNFKLYWTPDGGTAHGIDRSKMYDLVAKLTTPNTKDLEVSVSVNDWTSSELYYSLHGPYELIVEKTEVEVNSGDWSEAFWYKSDISPRVINNSFVYPTIQVNGKDVNFYIAEVVKDEKGNYDKNEHGNYMIRIRVNPAIPYSILKDYSGESATAKANREKVNYFHVVAGNIRKQIKISPLNLEPFLRVVPEEITIYVREYYSSGDYSGTQVIEYETNVDNGVKITGVTQVIDGISYTNALVGSGSFTGDTNTFPSVPSTTNPMIWIEQDGTSTLGSLSVKFQGINSGDSFWKESHDYLIKVEINTTDASILNYEGAKEKLVKVHIRPYSQNYIIHFKCNDVNQIWNRPHIYVYQCLEIPKNTTATDNRAGMTVGYETDTKGVYNACLEYLFTSGISFKGWRDMGGDAYSTCYTTYPGSEHNGFFVFDDTPKYKPFEGTTYRYDKMTGTYNTGMNFNSAHLKSAGTLKCDECMDGNIRPWPGIMMEYEGDGWWKYTLTDVATPGKSLIMFTDKHEGSGNRIPDDNKVGEPLFDFPDREGWFLYNGITTDRTNNYFRSYKPASNTIPEPVDPMTFRFHWKKVNQDEDLFLKLRSGNSDIYINYPKITESNGWRYADFEFDSNTGDFKYKVQWSYYINTGDNYVTIPNGMSKFKKEDDGIYHAYVLSPSTQTTLYEGDPTSSSAARTYHFLWPTSLGNSNGYFKLPNGSSYGWDNMGKTWSENNKWYELTFDYNDSSGDIEYKLDNDAFSVRNLIIKDGLGKFTQVGTDYYAYVDWTGGSGIFYGGKPTGDGTCKLNRSNDYLRVSFYGGGDKSTQEWQFHWGDDGNLYTKTITLKKGDKFRIGHESADGWIQGAFQSEYTLSKNSSYGCNGSGYFVMGEDFTGIIKSTTGYNITLMPQ